jgi:hypothetical protein
MAGNKTLATRLEWHPAGVTTDAFQDGQFISLIL